jgi:hypothetical protein
MTTTTATEAREALVADHRRLHELVRRLREADDLPALSRALDELHESLTRHFREEESPGGLYDALGVCAPEFRERLAGMVDDHFRLAAAVRDLQDRLREALRAWPAGFRAEAGLLADQLAEHERSEHELVDAAAGR